MYSYVLGSSTFEAIIDSFQRVKVTEDLYVSNYTDPGDIDQIGPGRITDVGISHIVTKTTPYGESRNYTITWTATGGDKNIGQGSYDKMLLSTIIIIIINFGLFLKYNCLCIKLSEPF